jgi:Na+-translocating ferredoxin:NAD+ oxidoreductase RnfD subunit
LEHRLAFSAMMAGVLATKFVYGGVSLRQYEISMLGYVLVVLLIFLRPLLMFMPPMVDAKSSRTLCARGGWMSSRSRNRGRLVRGKYPGTI